MSDEAEWQQFWDERKVYDHGDELDSKPRFVIDTPPPTVSGSLHIGHVFSFTHTDLMARYRRMQGDCVVYRMGWDDNGLPTDRRVQNVFNVRCDPSLPHDPGLVRATGSDGDPLSVSRSNYLELADSLIVEDERKFKELWQRLALSLDWSHTYATIDAHSRRVSQLSFLDLVDKGEAYTRESVTMWDAGFQTAVSQAEVEDREHSGFMHDIRFDVEGGEGFVIGTTRPELLAACIAVIAHPGDQRFAGLFGKTALTPLFRVPVPIMAHEAADPEKGTGIMMVCTFGDISDVERWREWDLPLREMIDRRGRIKAVEWGSGPWTTNDVASATAAYSEIAGLGVNAARKRVVELLRESGGLVGEPVGVRRPVRFYEKGDRPLEFVTSRQWFINLLDHREALITKGRQMRWHPEHFLKRYENWVDGLNQDWCVSRQRPFGVPIPVWYRVDAQGDTDFDAVLLPARDSLPMDPGMDAPPGFDAGQRGQPNGFVGDPDVFDTWATSSLTPLIVSGWPDDMERHAKLYPNTLRPHAHDIIRTWTFYSVVRAHLAFDSIPFTDVAVSGFMVDPDRKKFSKSKGNATILPTEMIDQYGVDATRYFAGSAGLGVDAIDDPSVFKEGKRLVTKLRNAARLALSFDGPGETPSHPLDLALLTRLRSLVADVGISWDKWDHAAALRRTESWFWAEYCDNYLELVKSRAYAGDGSALATLRLSLDILVRLFAPFLAYVTEEVWNGERSHLLPSVTAIVETDGKHRSVHRARFPQPDELPQTAQDGASFGVAVAVTAGIRKGKADQKLGVGAEVAHVEVTAAAGTLDRLRPVLGDVLAAGKVAAHTLTEDASVVDPVVRITV